MPLLSEFKQPEMYNYIFTGWQDNMGNEYGNGSVLTPLSNTNNYYNLFAVFKDSTGRKYQVPALY